MKKTSIYLGLLLCSMQLWAQSTAQNNTYISGRFLGWSNTNGGNPLFVKTNNITRMTIMGNTGTTNGFVGIGTTTPTYKLHVAADPAMPNANAQGWKRGMLLSNSAALAWDGSPNSTRSYFMAFASGTPLGDFYQGYH